MPFYVNDWLSSPRVTVMTAEQRGAYIQLMAYCWASGDASLPDDDKILSKLSGLNEGWLNGGCQMVRDCFEPHPDQTGKLTQSRIYSEWQKRLAWSEKSKEGGRKSGQVRRERQSKGGSRVVEPKANQPLDNDNEDLTSSVKQKTKPLDGEANKESQDAVQLVTDHYQGYHPRSRPGTKERGKIRDLLKEGFTVEQLCAAIDGNHKSPHHCGENKTGTKFQSLELIVRDSAHVNMFMEFAGGEGIATSASESQLERLLRKHSENGQTIEAEAYRVAD